MQKIVRRIIDVSDENNEKVLSEESYKYQSLTTAMYELNKMRKADRAMYRIALNKVNEKDYIFDDYHDDVYYMFRIKNICIECELMYALEQALKLYHLDKEV